MKSILAVLAAMLLSANLAQAQPPSPTPAFKVIVSADKAKGVIAHHETTYRTVPVLREVEEIVNGQTVKKAVTSFETISEVRLVEINVAGGRVITPDGKQVPNDDLWKRLKKDAVVVVSGSGEAPAPEFLRALNAQTLVIIPGPAKLTPPPKTE
jgi:hypothetical protein